MEAGKKADASLDAGSLWWWVFAECKNPNRWQKLRDTEGQIQLSPGQAHEREGIHNVQQLQEILSQRTFPGSWRFQLL